MIKRYFHWFKIVGTLAFVWLLGNIQITQAQEFGDYDFQLSYNGLFLFDNQCLVTL